jgi:ABC-type sugar transport system ATPase subunit
MIELRGVTVKSGGFSLADVSFTVQQGEHVALMGRTGQGKTTLLESICGLRRVTRGQIVVGDRDVTLMPPGQRGIGYVPQDLALFPSMTVRGHLGFALRLRHWELVRREARVKEVAQWLGIEPLLDRRVGMLSGGEAQRTALGRALSFEPAVLLLDEPMSALDDATRLELHGVIKEIRRRTRVTTLHVTHNRLEAEALADRIIQLDAGEVRA